MSRRTQRLVTIADGESQSGALKVEDGWHLTGIILPAGWDANAVTFLGALDEGGTYVPLYDADGELTLPAAQAVAGNGVAVAAGALAGWPFLKLRSGTAETPAAQSGAVTITCLLMSYG
jgi:hypothetical protein